MKTQNSKDWFYYFVQYKVITICWMVFVAIDLSLLPDFLIKKQFIHLVNPRYKVIETKYSAYASFLPLNDVEKYTTLCAYIIDIEKNINFCSEGGQVMQVKGYRKLYPRLIHRDMGFVLTEIVFRKVDGSVIAFQTPTKQINEVDHGLNKIIYIIILLSYLYPVRQVFFCFFNRILRKI